MSITQLIYVSSATRQPDAETIRAMLESSIRHNAMQEITGMLLYSEGGYMQVLEGSATAIDETMGRISMDLRHHSIYIISRIQIACREFGLWSMAFRGINAEDAASWPGYAPFFKHGFKHEEIKATPGIALDILRAFADNNT